MATGNNSIFEKVELLARRWVFPDNFLLQVFHFRQPLDVVPHYHDFDEIVLVENGSGLHVTEYGSYPIFRGDIFLIKAGHAHTYENIKNLEIVNMLLVPEALNLPLGDLKETSGYYTFFEERPQLRNRYRAESSLKLNDKQLLQAEEIILEIESEQKKNETGSRYFRSVAFMRLIGLICRAYSEQEHKPSDDLAKISRVLRFFEQNYSEQLRLEDLVPVCGRSVSAMIRFFREALGQSPIDYLINLRLEKAAALLRGCDITISEIAAAVGFTDSNYFSKMFSRKFELSPREYRKQFKLKAMKTENSSE